MLPFERVKKTISKARRGERGGVLVVALVVLLVGALMIPATLHHIGTGTKTVTVFANETTRLYSADAGVEYALRWLADPPEGENRPLIDASKPVGPVSINDCEVAITIEGLAGDMEGDETNVFRITSIATGNATGQSSKVTVNAAILLEDSTVLDYGLFALGDGVNETCDIDLGGSFDLDTVSGNPDALIYANGHICLSGSVEITGNVVYPDYGGYSGQGNGVEIGGEQEMAGEPGDPDFKIEEAITKIRTDCGGVAPSLINEIIIPNGAGEVTLDDPFDPFGGSGPQRIDGDLELNVGNNSELILNMTGPLWVTGSIKVNGDATMIIGNNVYVGDPVAQTGTLSGLNDQAMNNNTSLQILAPEGEEEPPQRKFIVESSFYINGGADLGPIIDDPDSFDIRRLPLIVSHTGDITVGGGSDTAAILYAPEGTMEFSGGGDLYGAAIAEKIVSNGGADIMYPNNLNEWGTIPAMNAGETKVRMYRIN